MSETKTLETRQSEIRNKLIEEIEQDLVGPRFGENEIITEIPTSAYLAGILFPRETMSEPDEEEEFLESNEDSNIDPSALPNVGTKPSSMGLTCRIDKSTRKVLASINYGRYDVSKSEEEQYSLAYSRKPFSYKLELDLENPNTQPITLSEKGIELRYNVHKLPKEYVLSVFLVNTIAPQKEKLQTYLKKTICLNSL